MSSMPATAANAAAAAAARTDEAQPDAEPSLSRAADPEAVDPASDGPAGTEVDPLLAAPAALVPALQRRGFERLTPVQCAILDADDGARDLRITSQTGSGKTVALGFALAAGLERAERQGPTTLVIAPTRELAMQVAEELRWLFADLDDVRCGVVTGGTNVLTERLRLRRPPTVLVGTPGRLLDHLREGALDLSGVCQLVLDEADQMLDLGFKDELDGIVDQLPDERRTHLVSATFPRAVLELANRFQREPLLIEGTAPDAVHADIEHIAYKIGSREHYGALVNLLLLAGDERTLVFVRTREDTVALADRLHADGFAALPLNGDLAQRQRTRTLDAFKQGTVRTLIATDVAARGLDVESVTRVVHVHPPIDSATYVHRSGRTGRAGNKGQSLMFVTRPLAARAERLYRGANVEPRWTTIPGRAAVYDHKLGATAAAAEAAIAAAPVAHPNLLAAA
ncbi:MAG: DEAD/DEAH box helicase, partial [Planctomycetes bacterium]|nr:DEAD/DEAH box helicase [Planctomycetota bacterium]